MCLSEVQLYVPAAIEHQPRRNVMKYKILAAVVALVTISQASIADTLAFKPGVYVGAELGATRVDNNAQAFANGLVAVNGGSSSVTQNTSVGTGRVFAGYKIIENMDAEVGYFKTGDITYTFSGVSSGSTAYSGATKVNAEGFDYSVLFRPTIQSGLHGAFLRLGGHSSSENATTTGTNIRGGKSDISGTGYLYGLGYDIASSQTFDIRLQWTHLEKVAGVSDDKANVFSVGFLAKF